MILCTYSETHCVPCCMRKIVACIYYSLLLQFFNRQIKQKCFCLGVRDNIFIGQSIFHSIDDLSYNQTGGKRWALHSLAELQLLKVKVPKLGPAKWLRLLFKLAISTSSRSFFILSRSFFSSSLSHFSFRRSFSA